MKYLLFFILLNVLFFSCNEDKEIHLVNEKISIKILKQDTLTSNTISLSYPFTNNYHLIKGVEYLIGSDNYLNLLEIINLHNKEDVTIDFNSESYLKESVILDDFYFHNMDSIFLLSVENNRIYLMDSQGRLNNTFNLNDASQNFQGENFFSISYESRRNIFLDKKNNYLYLRSVPPNDWHSEREFYKKPIISIYDIETDKFIKIIGEFPKHFSESKLYFPSDNQFSFIIDFENGFYYLSHRREHSIYKYDLFTDKLIKKISAKSTYLDDFDLIPRNVDVQKMVNSLTKDGTYTNFLHNPFKNQYYRIVTHNQELINPNSGKLNHPINNRPFSIIVFDENLEVIGESLFENVPFNYLNLAPHKDGILTFYKDENNEDINHFLVFDFE